MLIGLLSIGQAAKSQDTVISLETGKTALALQIDAQKRLHYTYLGVKLDNRSDYSALPAVEQSTDRLYRNVYNSVYTAFRVEKLSGTSYYGYACRR